MDLISREKALADNGLAEFHRYDDYSKMREYLKSLPSAFEGMTNREVIQALFPQIELVEIYNGRHRFFLKGKESSAFDLKAEVKWLNTPYQKGGE